MVENGGRLAKPALEISGPHLRKLLRKLDLDFQHRKRVDPWLEAVEVLGKTFQIMLDRGGKVRRAQRAARAIPMLVEVGVNAVVFLGAHCPQ